MVLPFFLGIKIKALKGDSCVTPATPPPKQQHSPFGAAGLDALSPSRLGAQQQHAPSVAPAVAGTDAGGGGGGGEPGAPLPPPRPAMHSQMNAALAHRRAFRECAAGYRSHDLWVVPLFL